MIKAICDMCTDEIPVGSRGVHNKCSWCSRDVCNKCVYFDDHQRSNCELCAREKGQKVRKATQQMGQERYLPPRASP